VAKDINRVSSQYGYGYDQEPYGGVVLGGKSMSKQQLKNRLKRR